MLYLAEYLSSKILKLFSIMSLIFMIHFHYFFGFKSQSVVIIFLLTFVSLFTENTNMHIK